MKGLLVSLLLGVFSSFSLYAAETVKTSIHAIYDPVSNDPEYLILANNGHVYGIPPEDEESVKLAKEALATATPIQISLQERNSLVDDPDTRSTVDNISLLSRNEVEIPLREEVDERDSFLEPEHHIRPLDNYTLTRLSYNGNRNLFYSMRNDLSGNSECYNRAHVWTWEIYQQKGYNTGKMFLFFTRRYINEYRYKWWFHVAPMINQTGEPQHMVLDRQFTSSPLRMHSWTDVFMRNDAHCPVVDRYSSYSQNQYSRYCYLIPASMYYWQPYNLDRLERYHTTKTVYLRGEINHSYNDALRWNSGGDGANGDTETRSNEVPENRDSDTPTTETEAERETEAETENF